MNNQTTILSKVKQLKIDGNADSRSELERLEKYTSLKHLEIGAVKLTETHARKICRLLKLETLVIASRAQFPIPAAVLKLIANSTSIQTLSLYYAHLQSQKSLM